jgi:hypothetical protein
LTNKGFLEPVAADKFTLAAGPTFIFPGFESAGSAHAIAFDILRHFIYLPCDSIDDALGLIKAFSLNHPMVSNLLPEFDERALTRSLMFEIAKARDWLGPKKSNHHRSGRKKGSGQKAAKIKALLDKNPSADISDIATKVDASDRYARQVRNEVVANTRPK